MQICLTSWDFSFNKIISHRFDDYYWLGYDGYAKTLIGGICNDEKSYFDNFFGATDSTDSKHCTFAHSRDHQWNPFPCGTSVKTYPLCERYIDSSMTPAEALCGKMILI